MSGLRRRALAALRLALAVVATVAVLAVASRIVIPKNNQAEFGQADAEAHGVLGEPRDSIDVLFLGDSEAYSSFSPLQLWGERGITSYVCATPGQSLDYTRVLLDRALERQSPEVVVLETDCVFARLGPVEVAKRLLFELLPVFEYHDRWKSLRPDDVWGERRATWVDELRGFRLSGDVKPARAEGHMAPSDRVAALPALNRAALAGLARACEEHGARLVLVSSPSTVNWSTARHNRMEAEARALGVDYVDLNVGERRVDVDWGRDTRDGGDHLNLRGARKVTSTMGELLAGTYGLGSRRGEAGLEAWDEALGRYERRVDELVWPDE